MAYMGVPWQMGYVAVPRVTYNEMMALSIQLNTQNMQLLGENRQLKAENQLLRADHQTMSDSLMEAHEQFRIFKKQLTALKVEVHKFQGTQDKLNHTNKNMLYALMMRMIPQNETLEDEESLKSARYSTTVDKKYYLKMVDAYTTLCMYTK
jgi:hypothetical protein